jgi:hypothetical protein
MCKVGISCEMLNFMVCGFRCDISTRSTVDGCVKTASENTLLLTIPSQLCAAISVRLSIRVLCGVDEVDQGQLHLSFAKLHLSCATLHLPCAMLRLSCAELRLACAELRLSSAKLRLSCAELRRACAKLRLSCAKLRFFCAKLRLACAKLRLSCAKLRLLMYQVAPSMCQGGLSCVKLRLSCIKLCVSCAPPFFLVCSQRTFCECSKRTFWCSALLSEFEQHKIRERVLRLRMMLCLRKMFCLRMTLHLSCISRSSSYELFLTDECRGLLPRLQQQIITEVCQLRGTFGVNYV